MFTTLLIAIGSAKGIFVGLGMLVIILVAFSVLGVDKYGIWQEKDLALDQLAADANREALLDAQRETIASHNAEINSLTGIFADRITKPQLVVKTGSTNRLQPLDEN